MKRQILFDSRSVRLIYQGGFPSWRLRLELLEARRWRFEAWLRKILPVPVTLKRLATAFFVLRRAIDFGMGGAK